MLTDVADSQLVPCVPAQYHRGNSVNMAGLPFKACTFLFFAFIAHFQ